MPDPPETLERPELHARLLDTLVPGALGAQKLSETATATVFRVVGPDLGSVAVKIIDPHLVRRQPRSSPGPGGTARWCHCSARANYKGWAT